ncbi:MAG TPA: thioredoxin domain-containing protein [Polyangia bacterium]
MRRLTLAALCVACAAALAPAAAHARPRWDSIPWWGDLDTAERGRVERVANEQHAYGACTGTVASCFENGKRIGWRLARLIIYLVQRGAADEDIARIIGERKASAEAPVRTVDLAGAPVFGPAGAPVTVVEFADFECPFCAQITPVLKEAATTAGKTRIVFKHFPLKGHRGSVPAAAAAVVANDFGKFWEMAALLFKNPDAHEMKDLEGYAKEVGIQIDAFRTQMKAPGTLKVVEKDKTEGLRLGVKATPSLFVNGREFHAARDKFLLQDRIEEEIDNLEKRK